jgi:hypothetical protein
MKFHTTLRQHGKTATGIVVPPELIESLRAGKKPPVAVTLVPASGGPGYTYRTTVAPRGEQFLIPVSGEVRAKTGLAAGDEIDVEVVHDGAPRTVAVPADLAAQLALAPSAQSFFEGLSYSHRRAYVDWIEDAKKAETRAARTARTVEMLLDGKKR